MTRYEIILDSTSGSKHLIGYTGQHSGTGIMAFFRKSPRTWQAVCAYAPEGSTIRKSGREYIIETAGGVKVATVRFSGRTERDAASTFEYPWIVTFDTVHKSVNGFDVTPCGEQLANVTASADWHEVTCKACNARKSERAGSGDRRVVVSLVR